MRKHVHSFKNAYAGLKMAFKTQTNYRIHLFLSVLALSLGWMLKISYLEFLIVITFIFLGLTIEMVNTAVEATCDAIDKNHRDDIKTAKDVSAAAMLIFSVGALIVACIIFLPKIYQFLAIGY